MSKNLENTKPTSNELYKVLSASVRIFIVENINKK